MWRGLVVLLAVIIGTLSSSAISAQNSELPVRNACSITFNGNVRSTPSLDGEIMKQGFQEAFATGKYADDDGSTWYRVHDKSAQFDGWIRDDIALPSTMVNNFCTEVAEVTPDYTPAGLYIMRASYIEDVPVIGERTYVYHQMIYCFNACLSSNWADDDIYSSPILDGIEDVMAVCSYYGCADLQGNVVEEPECAPFTSESFARYFVHAYSTAYCAAQQNGGIILARQMLHLENTAGWAVVEIGNRGSDLLLVYNVDKGILFATADIFGVLDLGELPKLEVSAPNDVVQIILSSLGLQPWWPIS